MKSREGTVVDADDLLDEMERLARDATLERSEEPPDDIDERSRVIGLAALKFMLLKVNPKTTLMFDPQASIKFEGDTGPYVLYAYARIASMLRKAEPDDLDGVVDWSVLGSPEEKDLALACAAYGETLRKAAEDFDTAGLAGYLLDLAKAFSRFYRDCPVLNAETPELKRARLELSLRARDILRDGLNTLTIETLESM
jgi:arginyl-tRNA synthetase